MPLSTKIDQQKRQANKVALIPSSPLSDTIGLTYYNLEDWSSKLFKKIKSIGNKPKENDLDDLTMAFNQVALISVLKGDLKTAELLCYNQLKWLIKRSPISEISAKNFGMFIQPVINIGRLYRFKQLLPEAFAHFDLLERVEKGLPIDLSYTTVGAEKIQEMLEDKQGGKDLQRFLWLVYVVEYLKNHLKTKEYTKGLAVLKKQRQQSPFAFEDLILEAELILLEHKGEAQNAIEKINRHRPSKPIFTLIFLYHTALNHFLRDSIHDSKRYCERLVSYLEKLMRTDQFLNIRQLMIQTGELCIALNMQDEASTIFENGFNLSKQTGDERFAIQFAIRNIQSNPSIKSTTIWKERARKILLSSHYFMPKEEALLNCKSKRDFTQNTDSLNNYIFREYQA